MIPIEEQIQAVERELRYRERVYARRVGEGKMTQRLADVEIARMGAVLETLKRVRAQDRPALPLYMANTEAPAGAPVRVRQFVERHRSEGWTEPAMRWLIFKATENGLETSGAILRLGRRVLIDEVRFFDWLRGAGDADAPAGAVLRLP